MWKVGGKRGSLLEMDRRFVGVCNLIGRVLVDVALGFEVNRELLW